MRDFCKNSEDYIGHGATRLFYDNFEGGEERECTDFSTPENFPDEIVTALKKGEFRGLGLSSQLLIKTAWAEYEAEYEKVEQELFWNIFDVKKNRNKLWR